LQNIHGVFSQNISLLVKIFITVFVAYIGVFGLAYLIYKNQKNKSDFTKSFFWNSTIRFITLGIVFGVVYVPYL
jgi:cell shape-determining protein MreD